MKVAMSNIAWEPADDNAVAALLLSYRVTRIDIAPGKYFPNPRQAKASDVKLVRQRWADLGIAITGMQSLLFGTTGLNLFGPPDVQAEMLNHLDAICSIAAGLGARALVFGSPKNRDRSSLCDRVAAEIATSFFNRLGDIAAHYGVVICLEPNPVRYGANYLTTTSECMQFVAALAHPAVRLQIDTGALTVNGENVDLIEQAARLLGHVHVSEADLCPVGTGATDHRRIAHILQRVCPQQLVSIEMLTTSGESRLFEIANALELAVRIYELPTVRKGMIDASYC